MADAMSSESDGANKQAGQMQEVLSSIKQIIDEDKASHGSTSHGRAAIDLAPEDEDVLELTELEEDEADEVVPIASVFERRGQQAPARAVGSDPAEARAKPAVVAQLKGLREAAKIAKDITGDQPANGGALGSVTAKAVEPMVEAWVNQNLPRLAEGRVEAAVQAALADWIDENLEAIVERIVREEVTRMVAEASED